MKWCLPPSPKGSNVEIDECEWSTVPTRDVWQMNANGTLQAVFNGQCLTLADNLEVRILGVGGLVYGS